MKLAAETTVVDAKLSISINPQWSGGPVPFKAETVKHLKLKSVRIDGLELKPDEYVATDESLELAQVPQTAFCLETQVVINPKANTALSGLYLSNGVFCSQCEAQGFRRITYFLDRPDILSRYQVRIEAGKKDAPVLLCNGNPVDSGALADEGHFAVWHDPFPKPSYLFALVAGDLEMVEDKFVTTSGRDVTLRIFVEHGKQDRCDWAMVSLKKSMAWDEEAFGREYDLDIFMNRSGVRFQYGRHGETRGLMSSMTSTFWHGLTRRPIRTMPILRRLLHTSTFTTGLETASPAVTGFSCA